MLRHARFLGLLWIGLVGIAGSVLWVIVAAGGEATGHLRNGYGVIAVTAIALLPGALLLRHAPHRKSVHRWTPPFDRAAEAGHVLKAGDPR